MENNLNSTQEVEEEISNFEKIISLNKLGALFLSSDKYDRALSFLKKTYDFYIEKKEKGEIPNFFYSNLYCNLAKTYSCLREFEQAKKIYTECVVNHPLYKILLHENEFLKETFSFDIAELIKIEVGVNNDEVMRKFEIIMNYFSFPNSSNINNSDEGNNLREIFTKRIIKKFKPNKLNSLSSFTDSLVNLGVILQHSYKETITAFNMYFLALICEPDNNVANIDFNNFLREINLKEKSDEYIKRRIKFGLWIEKGNQEIENLEINSINAKNVIYAHSHITSNNVVSFVCMKWGTKYDSAYVNKLFRGIKRNATKEFKFYCITDKSEGLEEEIKAFKLESSFKGWMRKSTLFYDHYVNQFEGDDLICFIDLDMIICANIDFLWYYQGVKIILIIV